MRLAHALRIADPVRLALVGAGGKTTAMFSLARELAPALGNQSANSRLLVTTSTHLSEDQARLADFHFSVGSEAELQALESGLPSGVVLFTGTTREAGRISGLPWPLLNRLCQLSVQEKSFLLVEADGSRGLPVKAPAAHEPAMPPWVNVVLVCVGLSAVGKPLDSHWVHRPELFSDLTKLTIGQTIDPSALCSAMLHPQGGLKSIPAQARRVALLNQADTPLLQAAAHSMAGRLLGAYQAIIVASLAPSHSTEIPAVAGGVMAVHEPVAGIVLAAGGSKRFGEPKQLLRWQGEPLVRLAASTALKAGLQPVVVVTGAYAAEVDQVLDGLQVKTIHNPDWQSGQSTSVKAGLHTLPGETGAVIYLLADQPRVSEHLLRSLVEKHAGTLAPLVAPEVQGQRANPVLFDRQTFPDLFALTGDVGGRPLFSKFTAAWLPWHDDSILLDIDSLQDYQRLLED